MLLFGMAGCISASLCFGAGLAFYGVLEGIRFEPVTSLLTVILSGTTICIYGFTISYMVYHRVLSSKAGLSTIMDHHNHLQGVTDQISKYISPQIFDSISENTLPTSTRTNRKKLTVFFSDIEGFTELSDNMESEGLTLLLNEYLDEMAQIVIAHGGTIDKFMGDGLMVFFGDPATHGCRADALACVNMALKMRAKMKQLRKKWQQEGIAEPLHIRMGINTGYCTVGNFGSESRLDYTIIGRSVNIASRLEVSAGRGEIVISNETWLLVRHQMACQKKPVLRVKGISKPIDVYQVSGLKLPHEELFVWETSGFRLTMDCAMVEPEQVCALLHEALIETQRLQLRGNNSF